MKTLYVLRHAKSSWKKQAVSDFDRPLSSRGKVDAPEMARRMLARGIRPDVVAASPAKRARKTAKIVAAEIGYPADALVLEPRLYLATLDELLAIVGALPPKAASALIVGHNPGLTELVNFLAGKGLTDNLPTAGLATLTFNARSWSACVRRKATAATLDFPKNQVP